MSANMVELTDKTFTEETKGGISLVDFWAPWCGPCRQLGPSIEALAEEYAGRVKVGKLNVDDNPETSRAFGIRSIPTIVLLKDGRPVETLGGVQRKSAYRAKLTALLTEQKGVGAYEGAAG